MEYSTLLKILREHGLALTFSELKVLYEAIVGRRISNGTVGDLLSRLLRKGLLIKIGDRYMFNSKLDLGVAKSIIDVRRAINNGVKGARALIARNSDRKVDENINMGRGSGMPRSIEKALTIASKLAKEDYWKAVDFIAHTIIGVRKTGTWLLWIKDYFIYREEKTGFLHYFRSEKLSEHLRSIGLREGFMAEHTDHSAEEVIKSCYRSYANARRLHYLLKDLNWFTYGEPLILELYPDPENPYIVLKKLHSEEAILEQGDPKLLEKIRKYIVYPGEHIDEENEETYHHRAADTLG